MKYSRLEAQMNEFLEDQQTRKELGTAEAFPSELMKKDVQDFRVQRAIQDFWYFDQVYFPAEMYDGGYYKPCDMHKKIAEVSNIEGIHIFLGARAHGKTVSGKKVELWKLITGQVLLAGTYSETIDKARNLLSDYAEMVLSNDRIVTDFAPEMKVNNADKIQMRFLNANIKKWRYVQAFSEGRSVRGYTRQFMRPQSLLGDDIETLESPLNPESVQKRIEKVSEAYQSLAEGKRVFTIFANNFSRQCAMNRLWLEQVAGILPSYIHVYKYPAWIPEKNQPLWIAKFPEVKSEKELREKLQPRDEADWQANFMQNPVPPEGIFFKREYYETYDFVPTDTRVVLYCDPNLSQKGMGDTTGMSALGFSPSEQKFYLLAARCKSYSDSHKLLDDLTVLMEQFKIHIVGMDGNVTQESIWTNNVRNWSIRKGLPPPRIEYCRYKIDEIAKNVQLTYNEGKVLFPAGFGENQRRPYWKEEAEYLRQLFAFAGKNANKTDDAPDSLIGAFQLLHDRRQVKKGGQSLVTKTWTNTKLFRY